MRRANSLENEKVEAEGKTAMNLSKLQGRTEEYGVLQSMGSQRVRHDLATEHQQQQKGLVHEMHKNKQMCTVRSTVGRSPHCSGSIWEHLTLTTELGQGTVDKAFEGSATLRSLDFTLRMLGS